MEEDEVKGAEILNNSNRVLVFETGKQLFSVIVRAKIFVTLLGQRLECMFFVWCPEGFFQRSMRKLYQSRFAPLLYYSKSIS